MTDPTQYSLMNVNNSYNNYVMKLNTYNNYVRQYNTTPSTIERPVYLPYSFREGNVKYGWEVRLRYKIEGKSGQASSSSMESDFVRIGTRYNDKNPNYRRDDGLNFQVNLNRTLDHLFSTINAICDKMKPAMAEAVPLKYTSGISETEIKSIQWFLHPWGGDPSEGRKSGVAKYPIHFQNAQDDKSLEDLPQADMNFERMPGQNRYSISFEQNSSGTEWTDIELTETIKSYLWMLEQEKAGRDYSKADVNKSLRQGALSQRTKASIEYRMQNISSVLEDLCIPRIKGYVPAKNVGSNTKNRISRILESLGTYSAEDYEPASDQETLDKRVKKILRKGVTGIPRGQETPQQTTGTTTTYMRDPLVKAWVLDNAKGKCEGCGNPAPFLKTGGEPFLEVHHVKTLAEGGADKTENAVALCPNCHRRCHVSEDKATYTQSLYGRVSRLGQINR